MRLFLLVVMIFSQPLHGARAYGKSRFSGDKSIAHKFGDGLAIGGAAILIISSLIVYRLSRSEITRNSTSLVTNDVSVESISYPSELPEESPEPKKLPPHLRHHKKTSSLTKILEFLNLYLESPRSLDEPLIEDPTMENTFSVNIDRAERQSFNQRLVWWAQLGQKVGAVTLIIGGIMLGIDKALTEK